jgi:hypothetical protein
MDGPNRGVVATDVDGAPDSRGRSRRGSPLGIGAEWLCAGCRCPPRIARRGASSRSRLDGRAAGTMWTSLPWGAQKPGSGEPPDARLARPLRWRRAADDYDGRTDTPIWTSLSSVGDRLRRTRVARAVSLGPENGRLRGVQSGWSTRETENAIVTRAERPIERGSQYRDDITQDIRFARRAKIHHGAKQAVVKTGGPGAGEYRLCAVFRRRRRFTVQNCSMPGFAGAGHQS